MGSLASSSGTGAGGVDDDALTSMPDLLARVDPPTGQAPGLPSGAYHSDDFFRLERRRLFARNWFALGFAHEVPEPGDLRPVASAAAVLLCREHGMNL